MYSPSFFYLLGFASGPQAMPSMQEVPVPMEQGPYGGLQFQGKIDILTMYHFLTLWKICHQFVPAALICNNVGLLN